MGSVGELLEGTIDHAMAVERLIPEFGATSEPYSRQTDDDHLGGKPALARARA